MRGAVLLFAGLLLAGCNAPQAGNATGDSLGNTTADAGPQTDAQRAYAAANDRMHQGMAQIDADPDVAFAQGMIPHHRGAIAMAEVQLRYGKDPELRALAQQIIAAQGPEIAQLNGWLAKRAKPVAGAPSAGAERNHAGH